MPFYNQNMNMNIYNNNNININIVNLYKIINKNRLYKNQIKK